jgi:hypothetical protein
MAAKEVIHFLLWTQLGLHLAVPPQILFGPVSLFPPNLLPKRRYPLMVAGCPYSLSVTNGHRQ